MTAVLVLGMPRGGTSALAGMLAGAGVASAGPSVRNWDNARGHFESLDLVRLDESVLARSGGHWLAPPAHIVWTDEHARERDRLLAETIDGRPALLKDPRMLLALPFWRASRVPFRALGIVRHPLAVARSLATWRGLPLREGLALWNAHARALLEDRRAHGTPLVDFDWSRNQLLAEVARHCRALGVDPDPDALAEVLDERLVHHDDALDDLDPDAPDLADALARHRELATEAGGGTHVARPPFPRAALAAFERELAAGALDPALEHVREALTRVADPAAVLVPATSALLRAQRPVEAEALVEACSTRLGPDLAALLRGKARLAAGDAEGAVSHLEAAVRGEAPPHQARRLLPLALRRAGRREEARSRMRELAEQALYPHDALAQLAEWRWLDGERAVALDELARAIAAAPPHRRGRLCTRRADWLVRSGDPAGARAELERACGEDPTYAPAREALARLDRAELSAPPTPGPATR